MQEPENGEECFKRWFSGHDMTVVHKNSQQQWLPTQDEARYKYQHGRGEAPEAPPLAKVLLAADDCWEINSNFLQSYGYWKVAHASVNGPNAHEHMDSSNWIQQVTE